MKLKYLFPLLALSLASCSDKESYSDLLNAENQAVNSFICEYPVIGSVPADSVFVSLQDVQAQYPDLTREEALKLTPFYRMDSEGYVYMQVVNPGGETKATKEQLIYFRFTRWNLSYVYKYGLWDAAGNSADLGTNATSFRFRNTSLESTTQWGEGIQTPLNYLGLDCEVRMVIKSYLGPVEEISAVYPYLYSIRYFPSKI